MLNIEDMMIKLFNFIVENSMVFIYISWAIVLLSAITSIIVIIKLNKRGTK